MGTQQKQKNKMSIAECDRIMTTPGSLLEMEELLIDGQSVRTWKKCPKIFREFLTGQLRTYSKRQFLSAPLGPKGREALSYHDVLERGLKLAAWMRGQGLGIGSTIAIGGGNCAGWVVSFLAIHLIGGVVVALNGWLPTDWLLHCIKITKPDMVLVDEDRAAILQPLLRKFETYGVGPVFCWATEEYMPPSTRKNIRSLESIVQASKTEMQDILDGKDLGELNPESDAVIFFSSGTSGPPKAVLSTQRMALTNLWSGLVAPIRAAMRAGIAPTPQPGPMDPQKTVLLAIPLFHVTGCLSWLMRGFYGGSKIVMMKRWDTSVAVGLIHTDGVTVIGGVPAVVSAILQSPDLDRKKSFETVFYGGAPPSKELAKEVKSRWPKAGLVQGYGLTETNAYVCSIAGQDYVKRPDSTGPPVPVCDIRIVNPSNGQDLSVGEIGLILVRGPQVMKCYVGDDVATRKAKDANGWFDTGDIGCVDNEGFLYIKDRLKDIIIRGGENITSADVENALYVNTAISEVVAIGVPDKILGEKVGAVVALRQGFEQMTEEKLLDEVKSGLGRRAWPSIIFIHQGALPRNVNGKVVKKDLKPILVEEWERRGRVEIGKAQSKL